MLTSSLPQSSGHATFSRAAGSRAVLELLASAMIRIYCFSLGLGGLVSSAPWSEENSAWNVNLEAMHDPARYRGDWPGHTYFPSPADWRQLAIYQLITDRFADGDPRNNEALEGGFDVRDMAYRHGGDFAGLRSKLHYIKGLGCSGIWISPVFQNTFNSYHQYAQYDFTLLDRRLGTLAELRSLVEEAHQLGIYVIIDVVMNHMNDFFYFEGYRGQTTPIRIHTASHTVAGIPEYKLVPKTAHASLFASARWCGDGAARWQNYSNAATGMLSSRDDCEDECASDPGCFYYLWKDDPASDTAYHCAGFGYCESTTPYHYGKAYIYQLKTTATWLNKWCGESPLWQEFGNEPSGNLRSRRHCRAACEDYAGCEYFLWKDDYWANSRYHCAFFSEIACDQISNYTYGAAKIFHVSQDADQHRALISTPVGKQPYADFWFNNTWIPNATYPGPEYDWWGRPFNDEGSCSVCVPSCRVQNTCTNDGDYGTYDDSDFHHNGDLGEYANVYENLLGKIYGALDDLRLGHRRVQAKYIAMTKALISSTDIDGFRIDTPMQVPLAFYKAWAPAMREHARSLGKNNFGLFGEFYVAIGRYSTMMGRGRDHTLNLIDNVTTMNGGIVYPYYWYYFTAMVYNMSHLSDGLTIAYQEEGRRLDTWNPSTGRKEYLQWTFCNNHDNWRMQSLVGDRDALTMCLAMITFWPGIPLHYAGDEQDFDTPGSALDGWAREELSMSLAWRGLPTSSHGNPADGDSFDMTSPTYLYVARLNALRRAYFGNFGSEECDNPVTLNVSHVAVFVRGCSNTSRVLLIASFHRSVEQSLLLPVPWLNGTMLADALLPNPSESSLTFKVPDNQTISVQVKPLQAMLLVPMPVHQVPPTVIKVTPTHDSRVDCSSGGESLLIVNVSFDRAMEEASLMDGQGILFDGEAAGFQCSGAVCILSLSRASISEGFHYIQVSSSARSADKMTLFAKFTSHFFADKSHGKIAWPETYASGGLICNDGTALCHNAEGAQWFRAQNVGHAWSPWLRYSRLTRWKALSGIPVLVQYHAQGSASFILADCLLIVPPQTKSTRCYSSWHSSMYLKGDINNWGGSSNISERQMRLVDDFTWGMNISMLSASRVKLVPSDDHWDQSYGHNQPHRPLVYNLPEFDPREPAFIASSSSREPVMYGTEATRQWMKNRSLWSVHESIASGTAGASEIWIHPDCHVDFDCSPSVSDEWQCHSFSMGEDMSWCQAMMDQGGPQGSCWEYRVRDWSSSELDSCGPCACCKKRVSTLSHTSSSPAGNMCCVLFNDLLLNYSVYPSSSGRCQSAPINSSGANPTWAWPTTITLPAQTPAMMGETPTDSCSSHASVISLMLLAGSASAELILS
eukprot:TRINITY_DN7693_c0_g1_i1.p1 TRINITY_DN7693_c0_g1~~TRINITY_DN7693_c0_g1_i1.p1  ORF type:complete len:1363 (-),score=146.28 TRINITY_DN7693_c0_g1_i1:10-4098(-)